MVSLNCDMGESYGYWRLGDDRGIIPYIDYANIACGFHAGDPLTMQRSVRLALSHGKFVGAHPSLPDREGFGRREMHLSSDELTAAFIYQIGSLQGFLTAEGAALSHVKPHGTIYGMAARDMETALAIARAVKVFDVPLFGMAGTFHQEAANALGVSFIPEFFADIPYARNGALVIPRQHSKVDLEKAAARVRRAIREGIGEANDGSLVKVEFETICMHSDPPNASDVAVRLRAVIDDT